MMNIHCHPRKPPMPFMPSRIKPEIGLPISPDKGIATMNTPVTRAR